jgi:hypothetical protein
MLFASRLSFAGKVGSALCAMSAGRMNMKMTRGASRHTDIKAYPNGRVDKPLTGAGTRLKPPESRCESPSNWFFNFRVKSASAFKDFVSW